MEHTSRLMLDPPPGGATDRDHIMQWDPTEPDRKRFGIKAIAEHVWQVVNVTASPLIQVNDWFQNFAIPLYSGKFPINSADDLTSVYQTGLAAFENTPTTFMNNADALISSMITNTAPQEIQESIDRLRSLQPGCLRP